MVQGIGVRVDKMVWSNPRSEPLDSRLYKKKNRDLKTREVITMTKMQMFI